MQDNYITQRFANITRERLAFYLMCLLSAAPLLFSHYPPMVDLPQHAGQVATLRNLLFSSNYPYQHLFEINWTMPYWGAYLPLLLLSGFLPILTSIKLLLAVIIIAIPITVSRLRHFFSGNPALDWLSLSIAYGFAFQWGFLNFFFGVPLVLTFLLYAFRYAENPQIITGIFLTAFSFILLTCHLLVAGFGCGMALIYLLFQQSSQKQKLLASIPFISGLPFALAWLINIVRNGGAQHSEPGPWGLSFLRPLEFLPSAVGETAGLSYYANIIGLLVFLLPFLLGFRLTRSPARLAMLAALLLWMLLGPNYFKGNYYTYNRFAIFILPFFLICLESPNKEISRYQKMGYSLLFALPLFFLLSHCLRFATFDIESKGYRDISQHLQPGKRAVMLIFNNKSDAYLGPQFLHFPAWYQAESGGVVDFSFAQFGLQVKYRPEARIPVPRGMEWYPKTYNWYAHEGWLYDYFIVKHFNNLGPILFRSTNCPVRLLAQSGDWWLFSSDREQCRPLQLKP